MCTVLSQLIRSLPITTVEPILPATACHPPCMPGTVDLHMCIKSASTHTFTQSLYKACKISLVLLRSLFVSCNSSYTGSCRSFLVPCLLWKCQKGERLNPTLRGGELCTCQVVRMPVFWAEDQIVRMAVKQEVATIQTVRLICLLVAIHILEVLGKGGMAGSRLWAE